MSCCEGCYYNIVDSVLGYSVGFDVVYIWRCFIIVIDFMNVINIKYLDGILSNFGFINNFFYIWKKCFFCL